MIVVKSSPPRNVRGAPALHTRASIAHRVLRFRQGVMRLLVERRRGEASERALASKHALRTRRWVASTCRSATAVVLGAVFAWTWLGRREPAAFDVLDGVGYSTDPVMPAAAAAPAEVPRTLRIEIATDSIDLTVPAAAATGKPRTLPPAAPVGGQTPAQQPGSAAPAAEAAAPPPAPRAVNFGDKPRRLEVPLENGTVVKVPPSWSRFNTPWFVPPRTFRLKSLAEARYRVLYSPFRHAMSDGIGHSMAVLNYEIRTAHSLGVACSHRASNYSSLTATDVAAVEDFFGWGAGVAIQRAELQRSVCVPEGGPDAGWPSESWPGRFQCNTCAAIRDGNKFGIKGLVQVPSSVSYECVNKTRPQAVCRRETAAFVREHDRSHTLFQLPTEVCARPVSDSQFGDTKTYYWHKYWDRHAFPSAKRAASAGATRDVQLSEATLSIAVHVRRGDFLDPAVRKKRLVIPDETYAHLICRAVQVVQDEGGVFSRMPIHVHIFSEGRVVDRASVSTHGVDGQNKQYYDSGGAPRGAAWWASLIGAAARGGALQAAVAARLRVRLRIAEPTLASMHDMVSADVFIGSKSGLSTHAIWAVARGVSMIPRGAPV
jgi:hypothetical protein